jgi:hypothetical protein
LDAKPSLEKHGVLDKISYEAIDATAIPFESHFDIIIF